MIILNEFLEASKYDQFTNSANKLAEQDKALGMSMIDDFQNNISKMNNHKKFSSSSNIIEKSVKSFLNHEYIGEDK